MSSEYGMCWMDMCARMGLSWGFTARGGAWYGAGSAPHPSAARPIAAPGAGFEPGVRERRASTFSELLLEPVVGERLGVERRDLDVAGAAVHRDRLGQVAVGLEVQHARAVRGRARLQ